MYINYIYTQYTDTQEFCPSTGQVHTVHTQYRNKQEFCPSTVQVHTVHTQYTDKQEFCPSTVVKRDREAWCKKYTPALFPIPVVPLLKCLTLLYRSQGRIRVNELPTTGLLTMMTTRKFPSWRRLNQPGWWPTPILRIMTSSMKMSKWARWEKFSWYFNREVYVKECYWTTV